MGPRGSKKYEKRAFLSLLWLLHPLVCTRMSFKNFEHPSYMSHVSDIPLPNLLMIQLTRLNWLLVEKGFCDVIKWHHIFCISLSRTEKFPVVARCSCARFGLDPKRGSRLPKEYSQQVSKKCPFSNSFFPFRNYRTQFSEWPRVFTWQHCLISLIWPQENIQS